MLLDNSFVRAKASIITELSLYRKPGRIILPKLSRGAMVGGNPEAHKETEGNLNSDVFSNNPYTWIKASMT